MGYKRSYYDPDSNLSRSNGWVYRYYSDFDYYGFVNSPSGQRYLRLLVTAAAIGIGWFLLHRLGHWMSLHSDSISLGTDVLWGGMGLVMLFVAPFVLLRGFPSGALGVLLRLGMSFLAVFFVVPAVIVALAAAVPHSLYPMLLGSNGQIDTMTYVVIFGTYVLLSLFSVAWIFRRR
jgi:hypothetical protein